MLGAYQKKNPKKPKTIIICVRLMNLTSIIALFRILEGIVLAQFFSLFVWLFGWLVRHLNKYIAAIIF